MRLLRTNLTEAEVRPKLRELIGELFEAVPSGVGCKGFVHLSESEFRRVMIEGAGWCVAGGYGWPEDLERIEGHGCLPGADPAHVSDRAITRGMDQLGTLGSGNHYLEIQVIRPEGIHDAEVAAVLGVDQPGQICVMLHCGSRGFGHQIGTDYLRLFDQTMKRYGITVRDRELACAPFRSEEGQAYFGAMNAAANSAFANRQVITHRVREVFARVFENEARDLGLSVVYDVCHNTAKLEDHVVDGETVELVVHRKGATRAFGPGAPDVPAMAETWGSTAHGAGRTMSRAHAKRLVWGETLLKEMEERGIIVRAASNSGVAEEAGFAYKDLSAVVDVLHRLDLSRRVVSLSPIGNIKG